MTGRGAVVPTPALRVPLLLLVLFALTGTARADVTKEDALALEREGRVAEAVDVWRRLVVRDPTDADAYVGLARTSLEIGRAEHYDQLESDLGAAVEAAPDNMLLRVFLGQVLLEQARRTTSTGVELAAAARARAQFETVLAAEPGNPEAALGLAHAFELAGKNVEAVDAVRQGLRAHPKDTGLVTTMGRLLYEHALELHEATGRSYPLSDAQARAFRKAQGALLGACRATAKDLDSCLRLAWASQTLGERAVAQDAYTWAMLAAPESPLPLRGIRVLHTDDPKGYAAALEQLAERGPPFDRVLLLQVQDRMARGELDEAEDVLTVFEATYPDDADGHFHRGELLTARGDGEAAQAAYRRAIELDGDHLVAAERIDRAIRKDGLAQAKGSLEAALAIESEYAWLLEHAPNNPFVRNNVAFLMREAWLAHRKDAAWRPVFDAAVEYYDDAVRVVGPWTPEKGRTLPFATRHAYAQIVNDAGVIRHAWAPARDVRLAEARYLEAMRYSDYGYRDAWTYLRKIYEAEKRWQELRRLALRVAEGLVNAKGEPLVKQREAARALADRLTE